MAEVKTANFYIKKLRWLDRMAMDINIDSMAFRVAAIIGNHLNSKSGDSFVGREKIANVIPGRREGKAADVKSVQRAVATLERLGYLEVFRPKGRNNPNTYTIRFPQIETSVSRLPNENGTPMSPYLASENGTSNDVKRDFNNAKTGHRCPPNLKEDNLIESNLTEFGTNPASIAAPPRAFREESSIARQNSFSQAELNRLVDLISTTLQISKSESWEAVINFDDANAIDALRRRMRRGELTMRDLEPFRQGSRLAERGKPSAGAPSKVAAADASQQQAAGARLDELMALRQKGGV